LRILSAAVPVSALFLSIEDPPRYTHTSVEQMLKACAANIAQALQGRVLP
jgi:hypothetical protein